MSDTKSYEGEIADWLGAFGFITYNGNRRIFFCTRGVEPDWRGSRMWVAPRIPVTFSIECREYKGKTVDYASDVKPLFPMSEPEDLRGYREISTVGTLHKAFAYLVRPCGDFLFLHRSNVFPGHDSRWNFLKPGVPVYHAVAYDADQKRWRAIDAELYSYDELVSFTYGEQEPVYEEPVAAEPEPELFSVVVEPHSTLLLPENRGRSLLEIIRSRK